MQTRVPNYRYIKFKYRLCIMGTDGTAELEFVLFGEIAQEIIKKPFHQLQAKMHDDDVPVESYHRNTLLLSVSQLAATTTKIHHSRSRKLSSNLENPLCQHISNTVGSSSKTGTKAHMIPLTPIKSLFTEQQNSQTKDPETDNQLTQAKGSDERNTTQKRLFNLSQEIEDDKNIFHSESEKDDTTSINDASPVPQHDRPSV